MNRGVWPASKFAFSFTKIFIGGLQISSSLIPCWKSSFVINVLRCSPPDQGMQRVEDVVNTKGTVVKEEVGLVGVMWPLGVTLNGEQA